MQSRLTPLALIALAACQGPPPEAGAVNETAQVEAPIRAVETLPPDEGVMMDQAPPNSFPAAFQGRWGLTLADCDPKRDDNKGLLTVSADRVVFYESRGTIKSIAVSAPQRAVVDLAFSGEGQSWDRKSLYEIVDGGKTLLRTEDEPPMPYRYTRCQDPA